MSLQAIKDFGTRFYVDCRSLLNGVDADRDSQFKRVGAIALRILGAASLYSGLKFGITGLLSGSPLLLVGGAVYLAVGHESLHMGDNMHRMYFGLPPTSMAEGAQKMKTVVKTVASEALSSISSAVKDSFGKSKASEAVDEFSVQMNPIFEGTLFAGKLYMMARKWAESHGQ